MCAILGPILFVQTAGSGDGFYCFHDSESEEATVFPDFRTFNNLKTLQVHEAGLPVCDDSYHKFQLFQVPHDTGKAIVGFLTKK